MVATKKPSNFHCPAVRVVDVEPLPARLRGPAADGTPAALLGKDGVIPAESGDAFLAELGVASR